MLLAPAIMQPLALLQLYTERSNEVMRMTRAVSPLSVLKILLCARTPQDTLERGPLVTDLEVLGFEAERSCCAELMSAPLPLH